MYFLLKWGKTMAVLFLFISLASGCSKSDSPDSSNTNNNPVNVSAGTWIISSYSEHGENKTSLFNGYVFTLGSGGALTATHSGAATSGSWSYTAATPGGYYGTPTNATYRFNLGTTDPLKRLNGTWTVNAASSSRLDLVNPEPAEEEVLSFSKQ